MIVTREDVEVSLGRSIDSDFERAQVDWWIQSAELQIRTRLGDLALLDQDVLMFVVVEAVAAKASNPEGMQSETIDDYTYRLPAETRRVTILPEWWDMLSPRRRRSRAYSVQPS